LELPILQVYIRVWCDECADYGGGGLVGWMVYSLRLLPTSYTTVQR